MQSSLKSEMQNLSFAHVSHFRHRQFPGVWHDFYGKTQEDFLDITTTDMAVEASHAAFGTKFAAIHKHPAWDADLVCPEEAHGKPKKKPRRRARHVKSMPKHFYIDDMHRSDYDRGTVFFSTPKLRPHPLHRLPVPTR